MVAHELGAPLAAIGSLADVLDAGAVVSGHAPMSVSIGHAVGSAWVSVSGELS